MSVLVADKVFLGASAKPEYVLLPYGNRHGLITGATGTGKTVSLQVMAEGFSNAGVPVFCADMKGDLAGLSQAGEPKDFLAKRAEAIGFTEEYKFEAFPVVFWDLFGKDGHPDPHDHLGDGAAAPLPHARPQRHAGRRPQHRLPRRRRGRAADPRPQGPPGAARPRRRARQRADDPLRQRLEGDRRHRAAQAPRAGGAGRRRSSSASRRSRSAT